MQKPNTISVPLSFDQLYLEVLQTKNKKDTLLTTVKEAPNGTIFVYCFTPHTVQDLILAFEAINIPCFFDDPVLSDAEKKKLFAPFATYEKAVVFFTDIPSAAVQNVTASQIIHYNMPIGLEAYLAQIAQVIGEGTTRATILYNSKDIIAARTYLYHLHKDETVSEEEAEARQNEENTRIKAVIQYCHTEECLHSFIHHYFGNKDALHCDNCSNCEHNFEEIDVSDSARVLLTCVYRLGKPYDVKTIADIVRGMHSEPVRTHHFYHMPVFGLLKDLREYQIQETVCFLQENGYLTSTDDPAGYMLTDKASDILQTDCEIVMRIKKQAALPTAGKRGGKQTPEKLALLNKLRSTRSALARGASVPTYGIIPDSALQEMVQKLPRTKTDLLDINGFSEAKRKQYGDAFLKVINAHLKETT